MSDTQDTDITPIDLDLEDVESVDETVEDTETKTEESPASDETEESEVESDADTSEETEGEEEESEDSTEDTEETDPEEARKEAARKAFQERQQRRTEREAQLATLRAKDISNAQQEGMDDEQLAIRELQWTNYVNTVRNNADKLENQYDAAIKGIDTFKNPTPAVKKMLEAAIDEFEARYTTVDNRGEIIDVRGNLYDFLQTKASLIEELTQIGARKEKSNIAKQKAAVTPKPSGSPKPSKVDKDLADFEAAFN